MSEILGSPNNAVMAAEANPTALKLPLLRCGNACKDFKAIIIKGAEHSAKKKPSRLGEIEVHR
jgi:hypothetical protein